MATFTAEIKYFSEYFKKVQSAERILFRWLYLSPEARTQRLKELMQPTYNKNQNG